MSEIDKAAAQAAAQRLLELDGERRGAALTGDPKAVGSVMARILEAKADLFEAEGDRTTGPGNLRKLARQQLERPKEQEVYVVDHRAEVVGKMTVLFYVATWTVQVGERYVRAYWLPTPRNWRYAAPGEMPQNWFLFESDLEPGEFERIDAEPPAPEAANG